VTFFCLQSFQKSVIHLTPKRGVPCNPIQISSTNCPAFESTSKRRRGYPSEMQVKRGVRVVHGDKELLEKLGRSDPCPCGSNKRFQKLLHEIRPILMA
jgi:hypothetical protein